MRHSTFDIRHSKWAFSLIELLVAITIITMLAGLLAPVLRTAKESGNSAKCISNLRQLYLANLLYAENHDGKFVLGAADIWGANLKRWHGTRPTSTDPFDPTIGPLASYFDQAGKVKMCPSFRDYINNAPVAYDKGTGGYGYNHLYVGGRVDLYGLAMESSTRSLTLNDNKAWNLSSCVMFTDTAMPTAGGLIEESFAYPPYWQLSPDPTPIGTGNRADPTVHFRHNGRANVVWCDGHASSESMTSTITTANAYGGISSDYHVGWFGTLTENAFWKTE